MDDEPIPISERVRAAWFRLRWRMARRFAPVRIMVDPFPDEGGVIVMYASDRTKPYRVEWTMPATKFRMKSTHRLPSLDFDPPATYRPSGSYTRFVGTVER